MDGESTANATRRQTASVSGYPVKQHSGKVTISTRSRWAYSRPVMTLARFVSNSPVVECN